uniref:C-type lectin domain-containing protein n=1 Tax=Poecilia reticulata TaxID=8081 RepID=A0A3P9PU33_POERE
SASFDPLCFWFCSVLLVQIFLVLVKCLLCQTGWIFFNDSCYFLSDFWWTWDESRRYCWDMSADLIIINNLQELSDHWLGLYRSGNDWVWIDGRIDTLNQRSISETYWIMMMMMIRINLSYERSSDLQPVGK